ncbi:MAG TPA: hypothetical protein VM096_05465 [Vicinamibacterales bacterium]|nr:hypothetical protein [Vicinamibacterales bacterium]
MVTTRTIRISLFIASAMITTSPALAQTSRFALDALAAADVDHGSQVARKSTAWFDLFGAVRIADNLDLRVRPVVFRRAFDGKWQTQMYELALRYERPGTIGLRIDAGQFTSPIGLSVLENRPDKNPVVSQHSTLYLPIPRYENGTPSTNLLAAAYPLGAKVSVSGAKWDARAAVIDSSPVRGRPFFGTPKPPRMTNFVAGVGVTPYIGLRFGAAIAAGAYAAESEVRDKSRGDRRAEMAQVEVEWAFRYTRIAGEFLWTRRELATVDSRVNGGWLEVTQTIHPRVFLGTRYDDQWTDWTSVPANADRHETYRRIEAGAGFRVTPEVTLRATYMTRRGYVVAFWDDQFLASVVVAKRIK